MAETFKCSICDMSFTCRVTYFSHVLGKKHRKVARQRDLSKDKTINKRSLQILGPGLRNFSFELMGIYMKYDVVDLEMKGNLGNMAFVEFPSEKMALKALKETDRLLLKDVRLRVERVKMNRGIKANNLGFVQTNYEVKAPDISPQLLKRLKATGSGVHPDELILNLVNEIELKPSDYDKRERIRFLVQSFLQPIFPGAMTFLFGSSMNTLGFKGCDVDMVANLGVNCWQKGRSKPDIEKEADQLTKYLAKQFRRSNFAYNVFGIGRARVPIVKFNCNIDGIHVDLSFKNGLPLYNTNLIKLYTNAHGIVRPYLMFIRYWAKLQGLTGGGAPSTLLTNYCLCMLMLFYLMIREIPIVPSVGELQEDLQDPIYIDDCVCNFKTDVESWRLKYYDLTLIDLALEFFEYYSTLDYGLFVISPLAGALIPKNDVMRKRPSFNQHYLTNFYERQKLTLQMDTALCVQDPFDVMHNIARGYSDVALHIFRQKCQTAASICKDIKCGKKSLSSIFEYYEIIPSLANDKLDLESSTSKTQDTENDVVSVSSEDSVELLQELESLERAGGVEALLRNKEDAKLSEDSGCEVNGSSESVNSVKGEDSSKQKGSNDVASEDEDITFIGKITVEDEIKAVEVVNLENSFECVVDETSTISTENVSNGKLEESSDKNEISPLIIDVESSESNKNTVDSSEEDSICVIEDIIAPGDYINPSKEPFSFTINYSSNCSYAILEDGSLRPKKRGHGSSSSKEKFVSDLLLFILKEVMKCQILKVDTHIDASEEYNVKNLRKRTIEDDQAPQKFLKTNAEESKSMKSDFTLLSSFVCQPLYRVWISRKKLQEQMKIPLINPLQIEMFISNKVAENVSMKLSGKPIIVKLWKDATKVNLFWISLRKENDADKSQNIASQFNDLFHKITKIIFSQIDDFLKWS